jgi:16S rRNA (uracil1498-N3)-methyltransferase
MQLFYFKIDNPQQTTLELPKHETRHLTKVLRKKTGDQFHVTDGQGNLFEATLGLVTSNRCEIDLAFAKAEPPKSPQLHIAIAPTKMNERMEWFLEKATEIGISQITPIICERSERRKINPDRFEKIVVSAMQQSAQLWLPTINPAVSFNEFIAVKPSETTCIAHCMDGSEPYLKNLLTIGEGATILIGPEGDFTPAELQKALETGAQPVTLGKNRLRTETAGVYSCTLFNSINELN